MDRISLQGASFYTHVGCSPQERAVGQHLEFDVDLFLDLAAAGRADAIDRSVDYAEVYRAVRDAVQGVEVNLLEAVAERAVDALKPFGAARATVRVRKPAPPFPDGRVAFAEVEVTRDYK